MVDLGVFFADAISARRLVRASSRRDFLLPAGGLLRAVIFGAEKPASSFPFFEIYSLSHCNTAKRCARKLSFWWQACRRARLFSFFSRSSAVCKFHQTTLFIAQAGARFV
jgi:hypothetical protein